MGRGTAAGGWLFLFASFYSIFLGAVVGTMVVAWAKRRFSLRAAWGLLMECLGHKWDWGFIVFGVFFGLPLILLILLFLLQFPILPILFVIGLGLGLIYGVYSWQRL